MKDNGDRRAEMDDMEFVGDAAGLSKKYSERLKAKHEDARQRFGYDAGATRAMVDMHMKRKEEEANRPWYKKIFSVHKLIKKETLSSRILDDIAKPNPEFVTIEDKKREKGFML